MTTNQTIDGVLAPRELLERLRDGNISIAGPDFWAAWKELRALLDKEVSGDSRAPQHQGEPVAWIKPDVAKTLRKDECCYAFGSQNPKGTLIPLYAEQPAPVAVVLPEDWQDQLFAEMERRFELRKQIDDEHMVSDDTQIGVEFARDWIAERLKTYVSTPTCCGSCPGGCKP